MLGYGRTVRQSVDSCIDSFPSYYGLIPLLQGRTRSGRQVKQTAKAADLFAAFETKGKSKSETNKENRKNLSSCGSNVPELEDEVDPYAEANQSKVGYIYF